MDNCVSFIQDELLHTSKIDDFFGKKKERKKKEKEREKEEEKEKEKIKKKKQKSTARKIVFYFTKRKKGQL